MAARKKSTSTSQQARSTKKSSAMKTGRSSQKSSVKKTSKKSLNSRSRVSLSQPMEEKSMSFAGETNAASRKSRKKLLIVVLLILGALGLYLARGIFVVSLVNGKPIYRWTVVRQLEKLGGAQVYDEYLRRMLVEQELQKKEIVITDDAIREEIDALKSQFEAQGISLTDALAQDNLSEEDLFTITRYQRGLKALVESEVEVTDEEVAAFYEENKTFFADKDLESVKDEIRDRVKQQKVQEKAQELISKLVSDAKIVTFVEY